MIIIGFDTSIRSCGYAVINEREDLLGSGLIETKPETPLVERVVFVYRRVNEVCVTARWPDGIAFENTHLWLEKPNEWLRKAAGRSLNAESMALLHCAFGAIVSAGFRSGYVIHAVTPKEWKGNQSKDATKLMAKTRYGIKQADVADAIGIALYGKSLLMREMRSASRKEKMI